MKKTPTPPEIASTEALFRYMVLSQVLMREDGGEPCRAAVHSVASLKHVTPEGHRRQVGPRTIYRWRAHFLELGLAGLEPKGRRRATCSLVLPQELLAFFKEQKEADPDASIPELVRRARELEIIQPDARIDRTTVWRWLRDMGLSTRRAASSKGRHCQRFAYPHRMDMVLCDGKHFRAGPKRLKRVALFFLDDATRFGLGVAVGTSESTPLFLRGLFQALRANGAMTSLYLDNGPGFIANDTANVLGKLGIRFIHGTAGYPEGHGKIERFNRTALERLLRLLDGRPGVDADCAALELRLHHFLTQQYNVTPHESLGGNTPLQRFQADQRSLRFWDSEQELRRAFVLHHSRRVSNDHVVTEDGKAYQAPQGLAGQRVILHCNILDHSVSVLHDGRLVLLQPVDLHANARRPPTGKRTTTESPSQSHLPKGSADMAFDNALGPVVDANGGFSLPASNDNSHLGDDS